VSSPHIYGLPRSEVSNRVGSMSQVARVESFTSNNGPSQGSRRIRLVTGGGLDMEILPDMSLDIGHMSYRGIDLPWISAVGMTSPALSESNGTEWLRSFGGGMLATCGLDSFGPPSIDEGKSFPMHGRVGTIPANVTKASVDDRLATVEGTVRQARVFEENLVLRRRYSAAIGSSTLQIHDEVTNESIHPTGHMMLYHFNVGWPLLHEGAQLDINATTTTARDSDAEAGYSSWSTIEPPQPGFREQVYFHEVGHAAAEAIIDNPELNVRLRLSFDTKNLPGMFQWKMSDAGHYVMGLEPTNVGHVMGRGSAREAGVLPILSPGETVKYSLELELSESAQ